MPVWLLSAAALGVFWKTHVMVPINLRRKKNRQGITALRSDLCHPCYTGYVAHRSPVRQSTNAMKLTEGLETPYNLCPSASALPPSKNPKKDLRTVLFMQGLSAFIESLTGRSKSSERCLSSEEKGQEP